MLTAQRLRGMAIAFWVSAAVIKDWKALSDWLSFGKILKECIPRP